jgi:hypothetical protein
MADDLFPAYIALIRRELMLDIGADAIAELQARLSPGDKSEKPPARAPAIARLKQALKHLEQRVAPDEPLDSFASDLQFLQLFSADEPILTPDAAERLLSDIRGDPPSPSDPKVVPMPRAKKRGGA